MLPCFGGHDEADLSPNTQVLGFMSCWCSWAAEFLDMCLRGLIICCVGSLLSLLARC